MQSVALNTSVFLFCFAFGFLLAGKRPILTVSTRIVLLGVVVFAAAFALLDDPRFHAILGAATVIANVLFVAFAAIDFYRWRKHR